MPEPIPDSLADRLSYLLGSLYHRLLALETTALEPLGIGIKHQAALTVLADEGPMTQQHLGQRLTIDRTTIVALIDTLHALHLVDRTRDPADRRAYQLALTPTGQRTQRQGRRLVRAAERDLLAALAPPDRQALTTLLTRAAAAT